MERRKSFAMEKLYICMQLKIVRLFLAQRKQKTIQCNAYSNRLKQQKQQQQQQQFFFLFF